MTPEEKEFVSGLQALNSHLKDQRGALQDTVNELHDEIVSQAAVIQGLRDEVCELMKNFS